MQNSALRNQKEVNADILKDDRLKLFLLSFQQIQHLQCGRNRGRLLIGFKASRLELAIIKLPGDNGDMSFSDQALAAEWLVENGADLEPDVYVLPADLDREVARLKLEAMGGGLEQLTPEQEKYLASWQQGT
jgi:hypothetical protein